MKVNIYDSWSQLKSILVGHPQNLDQRRYEEALEDKHNLIKLFKSFNIEVYTINNKYENNSFVLLLFKLFKNKPMLLSSPRNLIFTLENTLIECSTYSKDFILSTKIYQDSFINIFNCDSRWIQMPTTLNTDFKLEEDFRFKDESYFENISLKNVDIQIDGANILLCGKDVFCNITTKNNIMGMRWLRSIFPNFNFHPMAVCHSHIDGTIRILKPGLLLLTIAMKNSWEKVLPKQFHKWDKIFYSKPERIPDLYSSLSLERGTTAINLLNINENFVLVYDFIYNDIKNQFKKYNIEPIPISFRHHDLWGGGIHCATCDINREGIIDSYL